MNGKGKSRPGASDTRTAAEMAAFGEAPISSVNFTTATTDRQTVIAGYLLHGAENAIPRRHLRQLTSLSDRDLRRRIQGERLSGVPILSDNLTGYYLPGSDQELQEFVRSMRNRSREIEAVAAAVEGADIGG